MSQKKSKSDLVPRVVTAVVAIPILLYLIFVAPAWAFALLILWAAATSVWEYCNITYGPKMPAGPWFASVLGGGLFAVLYWLPDYFLPATLLAVLAVFFFFLFGYRDQTEASHQIGSTVTGLMYGAVLAGTIGLLHRDTGASGPIWILFLLLIVWLSDTGAYFTGRAFGKHKLYEAVSPNKSVEGALGGFAWSLAAGFAANYGFDGVDGVWAVFGLDFLEMTLRWEPMTWWQVLLVVVPANILGQCGDLAESLIKRAHGVKDSGTIIYGHGGMLDRIDALIFAGPWVYICVTRLL